MTKLRITNKPISAAPKKYVRVVLTEDVHMRRFVEGRGGRLEMRVGGGKWKSLTNRTFITLVRTIINEANCQKIEYLAIELDSGAFPKLKPYGAEWVMQTLAENVLLAAYAFTKYKTKKQKKSLKEVLVCGVSNAGGRAALQKGEVVARGVNAARDIANTTAEDMSPTTLGESAKRLARGTKVKVTVFGEKELTKLRMGALLAVGQGTHSETRLIVLEYQGGKKMEQPIVFIGKGITYDTGGLNVKPSGAMHDMHMDMSGGSSVIASVITAAKLGLKKNIIGLVPAAENAISDTAMRAGDIVTSMSGTTIEVVHTDAEGRMVLADALTYAARYSPRVILDAATLTGAALVALGQHASALMTKTESLERTLRELGEQSGDYVWPLPLWDEYRQYIKSHRADIANIAPNFSKFGGVIEGGTFLSHFAPKGVPWAHLDIAPRMDAISSDKLAKGSTGEPTRLLIKFAEQY